MGNFPGILKDSASCLLEYIVSMVLKGFLGGVIGNDGQKGRNIPP